MARVDISITRNGLDLRMSGEVPDDVVARITKEVTKLVSDRAAADPALTGGATPAPAAAQPSTDTQASSASASGKA